MSIEHGHDCSCTSASAGQMEESQVRPSRKETSVAFTVPLSIFHAPQPRGEEEVLQKETKTSQASDCGAREGSGGKRR